MPMSLVIAKSILTTVILGLAIVQSVIGLRLRGYLKFFPLPIRCLRSWHRWEGHAALILTILVALICVATFGFDLHSPRVTAHAVLGTSAASIMLLKEAIAWRFRSYLGHTLILGAIIGLCVLGTFVASALWYFRLLL
jgi:hypothetical protein